MLEEDNKEKRTKRRGMEEKRRGGEADNERERIKRAKLAEEISDRIS